MRFSKLVIVLLFLISFTNLCFAQNDQNFICNKTIFACYGNLSYIYNSLKDAVINGYKTNNKDVIDGIHSFKDYLADYPVFYEYSQLTDEEFISLIENWNYEGFLVPTGKLKASISDDKSMYFSLEAKINTNELINKIKTFFPADSIRVQNGSDGAVGIKIPSIDAKIIKLANGKVKVSLANTFEFVINPNGIYFNNLPKDDRPLAKSWNLFFNNMKDPKCFMHTEIDAKALYNVLKDVKNANIPYFEYFSEFVSKIPRIRMIGKKNDFMLMAAFNDESSRKNLLDLYKNGGIFVQPAIQSVLGETKLIDKAPWVGLESTSNAEYISSRGFVAFANIINNFCRDLYAEVCLKSPTVQKTLCADTVTELTFGVILYNMEHQDKIKEFPKGEAGKEIIFKLQKADCMKEIPTCLTTGKFSFYSNGDLTENGYMVCEEHGSPFSELSEDEVAEIKRDFVAQKEFAESLVCYASLLEFNKKLVAYNEIHEDDAITYIDKDNINDVMKKLYGNEKFPVCPTTKQSTYYIDDEYPIGYQVCCSLHGSPASEEDDEEAGNGEYYDEE